MRRLGTWLLFVGAGIFLVPTVAAAQASISGLVQDSSGAVLPGVTVEASSPALIEKTRSVVTDGAGRYSIVDLRPGTYSVTFALSGFNSVKRDGIVLTGAFNAEINADLRVGALTETITVSGASPVVDVKNTITQSVLTKEQIESLPGGRTLKGRAALIPGVIVPNANSGVGAHGSDTGDSNTMIDGYKSGQHLVGRGQGQLGVGSVTQSQEAVIEELVYDTGGQGAEYASSGVRMNMIPKEGGNRFLTEGIVYGSNQHFERSNISPDLAKVGFKYAPQLFFYDFNGTNGGPIKKDKLWYFASFAGLNQNSQILDIYFKPNLPSTPEECRSKPLDNLCLANTGTHFDTSEVVRVTHQLTSKHKLRYSLDNTRYLRRRGNYTTAGTRVSPEASWYLPLYPTYLAQVKYTAPITNRLLLEAGVSYERGDFEVDFQPANGPTDMALWDTGTGWVYENHYLSYTYQQRLLSTRASASYVTGSHSFKAGYSNRSGNAVQTNPYHGDMSIRYVNNGVPYMVYVVNGPAANKQEIRFEGGAYVQDQWKLNRLTINVGGRYDRFNAGIPAESAPASIWTPAISVPEISNVPNFNSFNIRLGGAYDIFGNGKTAVKASMGRYASNHALDLTSPANPLYSTVDQVGGIGRSWTDKNQDGRVINPDGTPQFDEIGPTRNKFFGQLAGTIHEDPDLRPDKNWSYEASVSHELRPRVSVSATYFHRRFYDLIYTQNLAAPTIDSFIPVTFKGPVDARLPNGGGEAITIYTLKPALLGLVDNVFKNSDVNYRKFDYAEFVFQGPLPRRGFFMTSWTAGKHHANRCEGDRTEALTNAWDPNNLRFCDYKIPFRHQVKLSGGVPFPKDVMVSGSFQIYDTPGSGLTAVPPWIRANYSVTSAVAGYQLTGGAAINNVPLIPPGYLFNDYNKSLDLRVSKKFTLGRLSYTALAEFNNMFNVANILSVTEAYGANWLRPNALQRGLNVRWGLQLRY